MNNIWERFDGIAKPEEVQEAKSAFSPVEVGTYECVLEEITPSESTNGLPMLKGKFRIIENNRILFYNQILQNISNPNMTAVNIAEAVTFISGIAGEEIEFTSLSDLADTVSRLPVGTTYVIDVSYGKKDTEMKFPKLKVVKTLDLGLDTIGDGDLPF